MATRTVWKAVVAASLIMVVGLVAACASDPDDELVILDDLPIAERARTYGSVEDLLAQADAVLVLRSLSPNAYERDSWGAFVVDMEVQEVFIGTMTVGDTVRVASDISVAEGSQGDGPRKPLLALPHSYLLFLRTIEGEDTEITEAGYIPVGWVAGYFQEAGNSGYFRLDPESYGIPERVTRDELERAIAAADS